VEQNLPPALAETIPQIPAVIEKQTCAIVCSGGSCQPPAHTLKQLEEILREEKSAA